MNLIKTAAVALGAVVAGLVLGGTAHAQPDLRGWDYSQTRTAGHYAVVGDALHVWTDDATTNAKVAGYHYTRTTLTAAASSAAPPGLTWDGTTPQPGFQIVINVAGKDRILVGEPAAYGPNWWMSDSGCDTWCDTLGIAWEPGGGSAHSAQLTAWAHAIPDAPVTAFGFSLGSGVKGDGTIRAMYFGDKVYGFKPFVPPTKTTAVSTPPKPTTTVPTTTTRPPDPTGPNAVAPVHYVNCSQVIAAHKAPLAAGSPGYRSGLDADGDGVACEQDVVAVDRTVTTTSTRAPSVDRASHDLASTGPPAALRWLLLAGLVLGAVGSVFAVVAVRRGRRAAPPRHGR